jgi:hypothetical protein
VTRPSEERLCSKVRLPGRTHTHGRCHFPSQPGSAPPATCVTDLRDDHLHVLANTSSGSPVLHPPRVHVAAFSLAPAQTFRKSVEELKVRGKGPTGQQFQELPGGNWRGGTAPAQQVPGRAPRQMRLVTRLGETTFPTSLPASLTKQGNVPLPGAWSHCKLTRMSCFTIGPYPP